MCLMVSQSGNLIVDRSIPIEVSEMLMSDVEPLIHCMEIILMLPQNFILRLTQTYPMASNHVYDGDLEWFNNVFAIHLTEWRHYPIGF